MKLKETNFTSDNSISFHDMAVGECFHTPQIGLCLKVKTAQEVVAVNMRTGHQCTITLDTLVRPIKTELLHEPLI